VPRHPDGDEAVTELGVELVTVAVTTLCADADIEKPARTKTVSSPK
jgi:hypothetical protein